MVKKEINLQEEMSKFTDQPSNGGMDHNRLNDSLEGEGQIMMGNTPKERSLQR